MKRGLALTKNPLVSLTAILGLAAVLTVIGHWMLFTTFLVYDDEGYVLYSLRNYIAHGDLYTQVYSQYGPFFYNLYDALQRVFPIEYDNVSGRWITLLNWLTTAGLSCWLVLRYCRSTVYALFSLSITFFCLWVMKNEPMHPGSLLTVLVTLGTLIGAISIERKNIMALAISGALIGITLALIKINVGAFFIIAVSGWMLVNTSTPTTNKLPSWLVALGCTALPFVLMQSLWSTIWVRTFALIITLSSLSLTLALHQNRRPEHTIKTWAWLISCGIAWAFLICAFTCIRGTSLHGLVAGIIIGPVKHPGIFSLSMAWGGISEPVAICSFALALWYYSQKKRLVWVSSTIAGLRFLILGCFLLCGHEGMGKFGQLYGISLIWLLVAPLHQGEISARDRARLWIGWILVFQSLHAYPVAGSQVNWGTCLFPAVLAIGVYEATRHFNEICPAFGRRLATFTASTLLIFTIWVTLGAWKINATRYHTRTPLDLHGAEQLRLSEDFSDTLRIVSCNLGLYAHSQFSFPGLYSINIWTEKPTPTLANATHWFTLLSTHQQQAIIDQLDADPYACVVVQRLVIDFLERSDYSTKSILRDYLVREFTRALMVDGYAIWVHKQRFIQPINIARIEQIGGHLRLTGIPPVGTETITRVELHNYTAIPLLLQTIERNSTANFTTTAISPNSPSFTYASPVGLVSFSVEFTATFPYLNSRDAFVILKSADGRTLARLRFAH